MHVISNVVSAFSFFTSKYFIGFINVFEFLLRRNIPRINVGMIFLCKFSVCNFDFIISNLRTFKVQYLIIILVLQLLFYSSLTSGLYPLYIIKVLSISLNASPSSKLSLISFDLTYDDVSNFQLPFSSFTTLIRKIL